MELEPFTHKLVVVLNKNLEVGRAMNALAHMAVALGGNMDDSSDLRLREYVDADNEVHPPISDIPFIVLKGKPGQIRSLRQAALTEGIPYTDFTDTMVEGTYVEQHERMRSTKEEDLGYFGICLFGDVDRLSELTKRFSLWR